MSHPQNVPGYPWSAVTARPQAWWNLPAVHLQFSLFDSTEYWEILPVSPVRFRIYNLLKKRIIQHLDSTHSCTEIQKFLSLRLPPAVNFSVSFTVASISLKISSLLLSMGKYCWSFVCISRLLFVWAILIDFCFVGFSVSELKHIRMPWRLRI